MTGKWTLTAVLIVLVGCAWTAPIDNIATERLDAGLTRALTSFAAARALNAAISVAQGTEIAIEPGGVGVNLAPGQLLDPVNDLIEQFSLLMLAASVALGIEKILVAVGSHWLLSLALTTATVVWLWRQWHHNHIPGPLSRALVLLIMLRFAIPFVAVGTDLLFSRFMSDDYNTSESALTAATVQVDKISSKFQESSADDRGLLERMKEHASGFWSQASTNMDISGQYDRLKQEAERWTEHIIKLIVIYLMQTLVIPLLLLWILYVATRTLVTSQARNLRE
jgi:hypothetical protein